jgi:hypothetical protein
MLADLRHQAEHMEGPAALPRRDDGEPVFDEPWQGRAVAVAVETVAGLGLSWEDFRRRLISAISDDPIRHYYESWLIALEALVADHELVTADDLDARRMVAASYRTTEDAHDDLEVFPIRADEHTLRDALGEIAGATGLDVDIDEHVERCAYAELQRQWVDGAPSTWRFRMFDAHGDSVLTVLLPNPFVGHDGTPLVEPDWTRLELWDRLRRRHLDLPPDPVDRSGHGHARP